MESTEIMDATIFGYTRDGLFMQQALEEAKHAAMCGEIPVGAVVVDQDGNIVSRAHNSVEKDHSQVSHAEMKALSQAGSLRGDWRLNNHWLYVTLEPCTMCRGLINLSRISGLVYGTSSPIHGSQLDNINYPSPKEYGLIVISGILQEQSERLLKNFFKNRRMGHDVKSKK